MFVVRLCDRTCVTLVLVLCERTTSGRLAWCVVLTRISRSLRRTVVSLVAQRQLSFALLTFMNSGRVVSVASRLIAISGLLVVDTGRAFVVQNMFVRVLVSVSIRGLRCRWA